LGLALCEGGLLFPDTLGPLAVASDEAFVLEAYETAIGFAPTDSQTEHFLDQLQYFDSIYTASGAYGEDPGRVDLLARGAVYGQMLGIAAELDFV
jgi:hypothetical protein